MYWLGRKVTGGKIRLGCFRGKIKIKGFLGQKKVRGKTNDDIFHICESNLYN